MYRYVSETPGSKPNQIEDLHFISHFPFVLINCYHFPLFTFHFAWLIMCTVSRSNSDLQHHIFMRARHILNVALKPFHWLYSSSFLLLLFLSLNVLNLNVYVSYIIYTTFIRHLVNDKKVIGWKKSSRKCVRLPGRM